VIDRHTSVDSVVLLAAVGLLGGALTNSGGRVRKVAAQEDLARAVGHGIDVRHLWAVLRPELDNLVELVVGEAVGREASVVLRVVKDNVRLCMV